jgi:hypothetical protein
MLPGLREAMNEQQPREATPLWVWLAFLVIGIGAVAYLTGYLVIEEIIAHFNK